jgi:hypothetical protein
MIDSPDVYEIEQVTLPDNIIDRHSGQSIARRGVS